MKNISYFLGWLIFLTLLGLLGVWVPLLIEYLKESRPHYGDIIINGSLSTYSIVILIDGIINVFALPKSRKTGYVMLLLSITAVSVIFIIIIYSFIMAGIKTGSIKYVTLYSGGWATFLAILMYRFKKIDPEEGADEIVDEQNAQVKKTADRSKGRKNENPLP